LNSPPIEKVILDLSPSRLHLEVGLQLEMKEVLVGSLKVEGSIIFKYGNNKLVVVGPMGAYGRIISPMDDDMSCTLSCKELIGPKL
jgi:hypothetical protein